MLDYLFILLAAICFFMHLFHGIYTKIKFDFLSAGIWLIVCIINVIYATQLT